MRMNGATRLSVLYSGKLAAGRMRHVKTAVLPSLSSRGCNSPRESGIMCSRGSPTTH